MKQEMEMDFVPGIEVASDRKEMSYWFCFQNNRIMVRQKGKGVTIPLIEHPEELKLKPVRTQYLGTFRKTPCFSAELPLDAAWLDDYAFLNLIELFNRIDEPMYKISVHAHQIVNWEREHQFCGVCGTPTDNLPQERAKKCPQCGQISFPRITPAIMVAIIKENKILLAKNRTFPTGFYSVLAGFVEPGEQLEECAVREVREEVGLEIKNLSYFGSQPWPFPNSLMIAFTAEFAGGSIRVDGNEIMEADWYDADNLPRCPTGKLSVAGRLIDWFKTEALSRKPTE